MISKDISKTRIGSHLVSTVELPGDLWFETMVFHIDELNRWHEVDVARYDTREEAVIGHNVMVGRWKTILSSAAESCFQCGEPPVGTIKDEDNYGNVVDLPICASCRYDMFGMENDE